MAQLLVRNLDDDIKARLQRRAAAHGRSMEEEARAILRAAADQDDATVGVAGLGTRIATRFRNLGLIDELAALPGEEAIPATFDDP